MNSLVLVKETKRGGNFNVQILLLQKIDLMHVEDKVLPFKCLRSLQNVVGNQGRQILFRNVDFFNSNYYIWSHICPGKENLLKKNLFVYQCNLICLNKVNKSQINDHYIVVSQIM